MTSNSPKKPGLLATARSIMRVKHLSYVTEKNYLGWIRRFAHFNAGKSPHDYSPEEVVRFLTFLAEKQRVAASTQNQALNSIVFLFRHVLQKDLGNINDFARAKKPKFLPTVMSVNEVILILKSLFGTQKLIASLLYGTGMRLIEALRLRVQDIDFERNLIMVKYAKGGKDRVVPLPKFIIEDLKRQLRYARSVFKIDLKEGFGEVSLPHALDRKYPKANKDWKWQYVFPSKRRSKDPYSGKIKRHHLYPTIMESALAKASRDIELTKKISCHTFRHSFATHLLDSGVDIRTLQTLLGHNDLKTTMIYTHVTLEKGVGTKSPLDYIARALRDD